jgi:hypothetical protein
MVARRTTVRNLFISLLLAVGSTVVVAQEVQVAEISFTNQMYNQANRFVERTVNIIATPFLSDRDVDCLAHNIFYESGSEPTEGKIAVGIVTLNRAQDPRFGKSVCEVVNARTVVTKTRRVKQTEIVHLKFKEKKENEIKRLQQEIENIRWQSSDPRHFTEGKNKNLLYSCMLSTIVNDLNKPLNKSAFLSEKKMFYARVMSTISWYKHDKNCFNKLKQCTFEGEDIYQEFVENHKGLVRKQLRFLNEHQIQTIKKYLKASKNNQAKDKISQSFFCF